MVMELIAPAGSSLDQFVANVAKATKRPEKDVWARYTNEHENIRLDLEENIGQATMAFWVMSPMAFMGALVAGIVAYHASGNALAGVVGVGLAGGIGYKGLKWIYDQVQTMGLTLRQMRPDRRILDMNAAEKVCDKYGVLLMETVPAPFKPAQVHYDLVKSAPVPRTSQA